MFGLSGIEIFGIVTGVVTIAGFAFAVFPRLRVWASGGGPALGQAKTAAAIVYRGREVLMVKRRGIGEPLTWYFPSGAVNGSEEPAMRAIEEVREETGVRCRFEKKLGERVHPDTKVYMYYFACSYVGGEPANKDDEENDHVEWVSADDAERRISTNLYPPVKQFLEGIARA